jgi:FkbM family methyltransferase
MSAADIAAALLRRVERLAARGQGKGWGTATIDREAAAALAHLGRSPALAVDIGANVGLYSAALLARHPGLELHLFEPSPTNLAVLAARFEANPRITINPQAIAESSGPAQLFADTAGSGLASLSHRRLDHHGIAFDQVQAVPTMRFEDYWRDRLGSRGIDLAKLDIEGHELGALRGFGAALAQTAVVQFEFGGANIDSRSYLQDFFYFFKDAGFALHRITPFGSQRIARYRETDESFTTTNFIAVNRRGSPVAAE